MKKIKLATLLFAISTFIFSSCRKTPEKTTCETTSANIPGVYKLTAATHKASATAAEVDCFKEPIFIPCEKDDTFTFNANGSYVQADIGIICSPSGNDDGSWELLGPTSILLDGDIITIKSFDCKNLILATPNVYIPGDTLKITLTRQ